VSKVEREFEAAALVQYARAKSAGYQDERYSQMLDEIGARAAAKDLVGAGRIQGMFARLAGDGRFELILEWLMLRPQFQELFEPAELEEARRRLNASGCRDPLPIGSGT